MTGLKKMLSVLQEIGELGDRNLQNDLLIEYSERFKSVPDRIATRPFSVEHRVPGCESEAYVWCEMIPEGKVQFYYAVENPHGVSAKALAVFLDENLSGRAPEEVQAVSEEIVYDLFGRNISMGKGQGLMGIIRMTKSLAAGLSR